MYTFAVVGLFCMASFAGSLLLIFVLGYLAFIPAFLAFYASLASAGVLACQIIYHQVVIMSRKGEPSPPDAATTRSQLYNLGVLGVILLVDTGCFLLFR